VGVSQLLHERKKSVFFVVRCQIGGLHLRYQFSHLAGSCTNRTAGSGNAYLAKKMQQFFRIVLLRKKLCARTLRDWCLQRMQNKYIVPVKANLIMNRSMSHGSRKNE
jgi:hypothetical protein